MRAVERYVCASDGEEEDGMEDDVDVGREGAS